MNQNLFTMDTLFPTLWVRTEHKPHEERAALTPAVAEQLVQGGYRVVVEHSSQRAIPIEAYQAVGCELAAEGSWQQAPDSAIIIGLKELDVSFGPFRHRHVHFAHVYKQQQGWQAFLQQFHVGGGALYDLEYLTDENGRRVAAFGYWAGYVGAALAVLAWAGQQRSAEPVLGAVSAWSSRNALLETVQSALATTDKANRESLSATVVGALGRSGRGAVELFAALDVPVLAWDQTETSAGGPFDELLQHSILVNCVFVSQPIAPFTTLQHLGSAGRRLSVISDVGCDPFGDSNPLPVYTECTSMSVPTVRLIAPANTRVPLDLIAIDHLPSLLPIESSTDFSRQLASTLLTINDLEHGPWQRAHAVFVEKLQASCTG